MASVVARARCQRSSTSGSHRRQGQTPTHDHDTGREQRRRLRRRGRRGRQRARRRTRSSRCPARGAPAPGRHRRAGHPRTPGRPPAGKLAGTVAPDVIEEWSRTPDQLSDRALDVLGQAEDSAGIVVSAATLGDLGTPRARSASGRSPRARSTHCEQPCSTRRTSSSSHPSTPRRWTTSAAPPRGPPRPVGQAHRLHRRATATTARDEGPGHHRCGSRRDDLVAGQFICNPPWYGYGVAPRRIVIGAQGCRRGSRSHPRDPVRTTDKRGREPREPYRAQAPDHGVGDNRSALWRSITPRSTVRAHTLCTDGVGPRAGRRRRVVQRTRSTRSTST